jgi:hypothetical protein
MVLLLAVLVGVAVGLALGGSLGRLADLQLRAPALFAIAIALQVVAYPKGMLPFAVSDRIATALWLASYVLLIAIALLNRRLAGFRAAAAGMLANLVAVIANGGHMPALPSAMADAGVRYDGVQDNSIAASAPHLAWLVDRWGAPAWVPLANVYSVGDVLLALGAILVIARAMGPTRLPAFPRRRGPRVEGAG